MARKFLTSVDLNQNELIKAVVQNSTSDPGSGRAGQLYYNTSDDVLKIYSGSASAWVAVGSEEYIGDAVAELLAAGNGIYLDYDDPANTLTISNTGVLSVTGTTNELEVSASAGNVTLGLPSNIHVDVTGDLTGNADTATALQTARAISLGGDLSGSASFNGTADITINATVNADSVELGVDTTGDYVESATAGDGISITGSGEGANLTIANTGVLSVAGTTNEVTVSASAGNVTIGLPDDVTVAGNLQIDGNLTVSGSTTYVNTEVVTINDNIVLFNADQTGTPIVDAGIEIERGDLANSSLYWDESEEEWAVSDGSAQYAISLEGHTHVSTDITNFQEAVEDAVDTLVSDTDTIAFTYVDNGSSAGSLTADVQLAGAASATFLTTTGGLSVDKATLESALVADSFTKKYSLTVGDNINTQHTVTHNLGTRDVTVQVYDISTYETVEVDVVRTDTNNVTVSFAEAPASNSYRVVVVG